MEAFWEKGAMGKPREYNAAAEMVDRNVSCGYGHEIAFVDPARSLTYGQLQAATMRVANLLTGLGIRPEARVAVLMLDDVDYPSVFWGAIRAGIVPVCLNTLLTADNYLYMLKDSRAEAIVLSAPLLEVIAPLLDQLPALRHVIVAGDDTGAIENDPYPRLQILMARASDRFDTAATCSDETAFWLYSSGSTGAPKGVRHVHTSPQYIADTYGRHVLGIQHDDICFSAAKMFFAYGHGASMALPMSVGATTVLLPDRTSPATVMSVLARARPTLFFGVPTLYAAMLADPACRQENGSDRLRLCVSAGEALPEDVGLAWEKRMRVGILNGIGSTEMLHAFISNRPDDIRYGTVGREFPGYRLRLVDEDGRDVADDELGELLVSGGSAGDGYWNQRDKSRATFAGDWVRTGDKYTRDAEGYYHYAGRADDMFKVAGRWVSPAEVEQALVSHPAVIEAAVIADTDDEGLVKPRAFVVLAPGQTAETLFDELKTHVKKTAGLWKYPRWIVALDLLPKTATGKIQRYRLREMAGGTPPCAAPRTDAASEPASGTTPAARKPALTLAQKGAS